jgi:hypothetical protein
MIRSLRFFLITFITIFNCLSCDDLPEKEFSFPLSFEKSNGTKTATYEEMQSFYNKASSHSENVKIKTYGKTDFGLPLQVVSFQNSITDKNTLHLLINNGIHPGEPDGIDASMLLLKDIINEKIEFPDNVALHIIPSYNLGGMLNRNSTSRANQNGPEAYGFRGNARNYDLNRDFIKMDTENMKSFAEIYHSINPDVYVETHVSNGADYQYTLTHLITQHNKLGHQLGNYTNEVFRPMLEKSLDEKKLIITPYVNVYGRTPFAGFSQFYDSPRYSTGYTALWNTLGLMIETHMLKPYDNRVTSTKAMLESLIEISSVESKKIKSLRRKNFEDYQQATQYYFNYKVDSTKYETLKFKGYDAAIINSEITGKARLKYNSNEPVQKDVKYFNQFKATDSLIIPDFYIVKSSWQSVIDRFKTNNIEMKPLPKDTTISVEAIQIHHYKTYSSAYEGHYPHYNTKVNYNKESLKFYQGDFLISTRQIGIRYIIETLEPELKDSFFNWNFFDTVLQQKEGFSAYVFEDYALEFLRNNPEINKVFLEKKSNDSNFEKNANLQLKWIYEKSPLYEKSHLRLPVFRVLN